MNMIALTVNQRAVQAWRSRAPTSRISFAKNSI
jgi:hypothetical protein